VQQAAHERLACGGSIVLFVKSTIARHSSPLSSTGLQAFMEGGVFAAFDRVLQALQARFGLVRIRAQHAHEDLGPGTDSAMHSGACWL
jgi:hypothetical protein